MPRVTSRLLAAMASLLMCTALVQGTSPSQASTLPPSVGVQFHGMWSSYDDASRARVLDQLAAGGASWVRIDVSWAMLQPKGRDSFDLSWGVPFVDRVLRMATSRGLKPLVTLWLTPAWANGGAGDRVLPTDPRDYARAAAWASKRWAGVVPAWEIWNEPNHTHFLKGADPVAYTHLLRAAYPAIKAANPSAKVVFGGPSQVDTTWIAKAYAAGARGFFDVMAAHPYQAMADQAPETPDDGSPYHLTHLAALHALMVAHGDGAKQIWATEFGWSSHANTGTEANWLRGVTRQQQADFLVRTLQLLERTMPYVTHVFWYTDRDFAASDVQNSNLGLFDRSLAPKPAYVSMRTYLASRGVPVVTRAAALTRDPSRVFYLPRWGRTLTVTLP